MPARLGSAGVRGPSHVEETDERLVANLVQRDLERVARVCDACERLELEFEGRGLQG